MAFRKTTTMFGALLFVSGLAHPVFAQQADPQMPPSTVAAPPPSPTPQPSEVQQQQADQQTQNPGG